MAKSAEDVLALAKENGIELTEEGATDYFNQINSALPDDMLEKVNGGIICYCEDGREIVSYYGKCEYYEPRESEHDYWNCGCCKYIADLNPRVYVCNHNANRKK